MTTRGTVCQTEWGKKLGEFVRVLHPPHSSRDRAHVHRRGARSIRRQARERCYSVSSANAYGTKIVLPLNGYDKARDPSDKRQHARSRSPAGGLSRSRSGEPANAGGGAEKVAATPTRRTR
jgi:hypothetical protein